MFNRAHSFTKALLLVLCACFICLGGCSGGSRGSNGGSAEYRVQALIVDQNGVAVENAIVRVELTGLQARTNQDGLAEVEAPQDTDLRLIVEAKGQSKVFEFETAKQVIAVLRVAFTVTPTAIELTDIEVELSAGTGSSANSGESDSSPQMSDPDEQSGQSSGSSGSAGSGGSGSSDNSGDSGSSDDSAGSDDGGAQEPVVYQTSFSGFMRQADGTPEAGTTIDVRVTQRDDLRANRTETYSTVTAADGSWSVQFSLLSGFIYSIETLIDGELAARSINQNEEDFPQRNPQFYERGQDGSVRQTDERPVDSATPASSATPAPSADPTPAPTTEQTPAPTVEPTPRPTREPTPAPTRAPADDSEHSADKPSRR